jgi:hypothetical protein
MGLLSSYQSLKLSDDWLRAIGRVVVEDARLDKSLQQIIWGFLNLDEFRDPQTGPALTAEMGAPLMYKIIRSLADKLLDSPGPGELNAIIAGIEKLREDRNIKVHGEWIPFKDPVIKKALR